MIAVFAVQSFAAAHFECVPTNDRGFPSSVGLVRVRPKGGIKYTSAVPSRRNRPFGTGAVVRMSRNPNDSAEQTRIGSVDGPNPYTFRPPPKPDVPSPRDWIS